MTRALDAILNQPWAIRPEWLHTIGEIAAREGDLVRIAERHATTPEALSAKIGRRTEWGTLVRDGVAIIPIGGPIFPRANLMTQYSGATSLDMVSLAFEDALQSEEISAVLLDIDSPGGIAAGIGEMAGMIRAGTARKPVTAYIASQACSAAYWLGAAAGDVVIHATAMAGNIGVVAGARVQENPDAQGYRLIEVVSSNAPDKRPDPRTEEGAATIRAVLDQVEAQFIDDVAAFRGVSREAVLRDFGRGSNLVGSKAVAAGMADRLGTFEETLSELKRGVTPTAVAARSAARPAAAPAVARSSPEPISGSEAIRRAALQAVAEPGCEDLLAAHVADMSKTDRDLVAAQIRRRYDAS